MSRAGAATRARVVESAMERMRRQGVGATSMLDAIADAGASRGSLYHYFPGGRAQLIEEATALAVQEYTDAFSLIVELDAEQALPLVVEYWRIKVAESDFEAGCAVAAAALGGSDIAAARAKAGEAFTSWIGMIEQVLRNSGVPADRIPSVATLALSAIEGAVVIGLAHRSVEPMEQIAVELLELVRALRA
ncbi:MAG TPA: TetR/AcrR family transcriptional regulator [Nocardioidaceae bacterium]|nr:TetR/AcrR family transcriptional regulator [Nocardioidaceae bacterium]